jgi:hypothetical protein
MSDSETTAQFLLLILGKVKRAVASFTFRYDLAFPARKEHDMNNGKQFQHRMLKFEHSMHNWNNIDIGLALLAIGLLLLTVGETLRVHFNLIAGTVICWCGILFIYIAVAVFTAVLKMLLDDTFGTDDF